MYIHNYKYIYIYLQTYINIHMRGKKQLQLFRFSPGSRNTPCISLFDVETYRIYSISVCQWIPSVFFSMVIFFIPFYSHVYWSNSPLLLNYTYTVVSSLVLPPHDFGSRLPVLFHSFPAATAPWAATITATKNSVVFVTARHQFKDAARRGSVTFLGRVPFWGRDSVHGWPYSNDHHGGLGSSYSPQPCTMWGFMWNHVKPGRFFSYIIFAAWFGLCPAWTFCVHRHASLHSQFMPISSNFKF